MSDFIIVLEDDEETGRRMKYYSRAADETYWTELWKRRGECSYDRELRGYLPHQLRDTFKRWVRPGGRVLEAGCGPGHFTVAAHALGYRAEGLDWSGETIELLCARFPEIPWHVDDVRKTRFPDRSFDAVYSPGVCEHFEEGPAQILTETWRILRPGGVAVISTPCFNRWLRKRPGLFSSASEASGEFHQYGFSPEGLSRVLERLGYDVLQVRPYHAIATMIEFAGWRMLGPAARYIGYAMDKAPVTRQWGYGCVWVARRPLGS